MTIVNQSELQTAVSVDELAALAANPLLTDLLFYVRDGSQAAENDKHRRVAGDVLRTLLAPVLKTVNSESLFGSGNIAISGGASIWPALDSTQQTANFNFGSTSRIVPISLASGNIVGTLPAAPADGQICGVVAQAINGGSANRFTLGLNGKTVDGSGTSTVTRTTGFETETVNGVWPPNNSLITELGLSSISRDGNAVQTQGGILNTPRSGSRCMNVGANQTLANALTMVTPSLPTGGSFGYWFWQWNSGYGRHRVYLNNAIVSSPSGTNSYTQNSIALAAGVNTIRFETLDDTTFKIDDLSLSGIPGTPPSDWTNVDARNVGPQGIGIWQYSSANDTWHTLIRRQLGT